MRQLAKAYREGGLGLAGCFRCFSMEQTSAEAGDVRSMIILAIGYLGSVQCRVTLLLIQPI